MLLKKNKLYLNKFLIKFETINLDFTISRTSLFVGATLVTVALP